MVFKEMIPVKPQAPINTGCWFTVISLKERHGEWFNNAGTSVKSKTDEGDDDLTRVWRKMLCCLCTEQEAGLWKSVYASETEKHNLQCSVVFVLVESQKDSSSYILRWFPEVCAHNMTKGEKTATVQVCLIDLQFTFLT